MFNSNSKRVVVIKDIPSNFIEEAILILKPEARSKSGNNPENASNKSRSKTDFILKEAELIINNYVKEADAFLGNRKKQPKAGTVQKRKIPVNTTINLVLIGSILMLVLMIVKLF